MMIYVALAAVVLGVAMNLFAIRRPVHIFQLESYKPQMYFRCIREGGNKSFGGVVAASLTFLPIQIGVIVLGLMLSPAKSGLRWAYVVLPMLVCASLLAVRLTHEMLTPAKKPLVVTDRVKRLLLWYALFALAECTALVCLGMLIGNPLVPEAGLALLYLTLLWSRRRLIWAAKLAEPGEKRIAQGFFNEAKQKLADMKDTTCVGITGSFGKTSTKFIMGAILGEKYKVTVTPHSYNTPMGVTRFVREQMTEPPDVFVVEMGARHIGNIAEMCDLVQPKYGLITSIGPQHLETFGSVENVAATKYELAKALPEDGMAFFPADGSFGETLYRRHPGRKALFGFEGEDLYARAKEISCGPEGSRFTLCFGEQCVPCETKLLGRHNILNILCAAAAAREMGLSPEQIASGITKIEPVPHRLQILPTDNGVTVIDDSFNSNPEGSQAALEVLKTFVGRKILITPGMVELGEREEELNERFGAKIAQAADFVILVGKKRARIIRKGMLDNGFDENNLLVFSTLAEASAELAKITRAGDVVLFENDLPDNYEEK